MSKSFDRSEDYFGNIFVVNFFLDVHYKSQFSVKMMGHWILEHPTAIETPASLR